MPHFYLFLSPLFAEGVSPSVAIAKMTNSPLKIISILETISIVGLVFGCVFSYLLGLVTENVSVKKQMNLCMNILERSSKKKTTNKDRS